MVVVTLSTTVFGTDNYDVTQFKDKAISGEGTTNAVGKIQNIVGSIITVVQVIGVGVAIIMLIVMAIKYISAAPSEKAEIKKSITIYVVGAVVLFAASGLLAIIKTFAVAIND